MAPAQVQATVREGLLVLEVVHQARQGSRVACVVVNGHLCVGRTAPAPRVLKAARHSVGWEGAVAEVAYIR